MSSTKTTRPQPTDDRLVDSNFIIEDDREYLYVPVKVWNARARVQTLNAKELIDLVEIGGDNIGFKLIALCLVDHDKHQLFRGSDEQVITISVPAVAPETKATLSPSLEAAMERVKQKNPKAVNELSTALIALNGITMKTPETPEPENEIKNDSGETPVDVSPSV